MVIGSVTKAAAISSPAAPTAMITRPMYPGTVRTCRATATTMPSRLTARAPKATLIAQPNRPSAYSLTKRQVGSYSGSMTWSPTSSKANNPPA